MKEIWKAITTYISDWFYSKIELTIDGTCVCGHGRNTHFKGKYKCNQHFPPEENAKEEWKKKWLECSCVFYIEDKDDDEEDDPELEPEVPSDAELERLYQR